MIEIGVGKVAILKDGTPINYLEEITDDLMIVSTGFMPLIEGETVPLNGMEAVAIETAMLQAQSLRKTSILKSSA